MIDGNEDRIASSLVAQQAVLKDIGIMEAIKTITSQDALIITNKAE